MVPDFMMSLPHPTEGTKRMLAELKIINCCPSRYSVGVDQKGVDKRAGLLQGEYKKKAKDVDTMYGDVPAGQVGPVQRHLNSYGKIIGIVVGAWAEGSEDLHNLIQNITDSRSNYLELTRGRPASDGERALMLGQIRRRISVASVRANANCLLDRLKLVGPEAGKAAERRRWRSREEQMMRHEEEAVWLAKTRHHGICHRGQFSLL